MTVLAPLPSPERASQPQTDEPAPAGSLLRSAIWAVIARGWSVAASAALGILLPRWFGANVVACGEVLLIMSLVGIAGMIASFGLPETMIRLVASQLARGEAGSIRTLIQRCSRLLMVTTLITATVTSGYFWVSGFARFHLPTDGLLALVIGVAIVALAWQMVDAAVLRGLHEVRWANVLSGGQSGGPIALTMFLLMVAAVFLTHTPIAVTSTLVAQLLAVAILCTTSITVWRMWVAIPPTTTVIMKNVPSVWELAVDAFPIAVSQLAAFCTLSADLWIAGGILGTDDVAYYGCAKRLVLLLGIPQQLAMLTIIAIIPDLYARGRRDELQRVVRKSTTLAAVPAFLASVALLALPQQVLTLAFGPQYRVAAGVLVVLTLGQLTASCVGPCGYVLVMTGRRWTVLAITMICGVSSIIIGSLSAYYFGMLGLALASAGCSATQMILEWLAVKGFIGIWCHASPAALLAAIKPTRGSQEEAQS
jgi:O-antigen/teichoic acid export membrane protein